MARDSVIDRKEGAIRTRHRPTNPSNPDDRYQQTAQYAQPGGYASLDPSGLVPIAEVPIGTTAITACAGNDPRLSDSRPPTAHHTTHENGGGDQVSVAGLTGLLATPQTPAGHHANHEPGGSDQMAVDAPAATASLRTIGTAATQACAGNDGRLSDSRTPTGHHSSHEPGGSDAMAVDAAAGTGSLRTLGTTSTKACAGNDGRLSDSRTPTLHATSHGNAGSDPVTDVAAPLIIGPRAKIQAGVSSSVAGTTAFFVQTGATTSATLLMVSGDDGAGKRFMDLVLYFNGGIQVVFSGTMAGTPAARTYSDGGGGVLQLAMASGTYTVYATAFEQRRV